MKNEALETPVGSGSSARRRRFLTAEWRYLAMLNYLIEPDLLKPFIPAGTTPDTYQGNCYVSMVGFLFQKTKVFGLPIPGHRNFEELNLRFYVRRCAEGDWRRGVVFIKELVPKPAIAAVARACFNENYVAVPMRHQIELTTEGSLAALEYQWHSQGRWQRLSAKTEGEPRAVATGSPEEFITEHYWGYARTKDGDSLEYQVEHPRWRVWPVTAASLDCAAEALYGEAFASALGGSPASAFVAEGSAVTVFRGTRVF